MKKKNTFESNLWSLGDNHGGKTLWLKWVSFWGGCQMKTLPRITFHSGLCYHWKACQDSEISQSGKHRFAPEIQRSHLEEGSDLGGAAAVQPAAGIIRRKRLPGDEHKTPAWHERTSFPLHVLMAVQIYWSYFAKQTAYCSVKFPYFVWLYLLEETRQTHIAEWGQSRLAASAPSAWPPRQQCWIASSTPLCHIRNWFSYLTEISFLRKTEAQYLL